ncbi:ERCC4 domain-domain-containing protein [Microdochium bolleyi]|uniref:ERCC4 domain-domain-containing protein n=1 Tax=Microdochium bolleyi TaxID=196109 RepID=A0A136JJM3_9PEZI|nr:ERCC4 domain-domain-containing protein [Microdochium bolleyi]
MPAEVIDLLSSSPVAALASIDHADVRHVQHEVSHQEVATNTASVNHDVSANGGFPSSLQFSDFPVTSSLPDFQQQLLPQLPALPAGAVRTEDAEVLFLSDDFDTTGDLEPQVAKRSRISSSLRRVRSEVIDQSHIASKTSGFDDIQHSSSPGRRMAIAGYEVAQCDISSDPFATSPPKAAASRKKSSLPRQLLPSLSSDPFSSPPRTSKARGSSARDGPIDNSNGARPAARPPTASKVIDMIDLSSDIDNDKPPPPAQRSSKGKEVAWDPISSSMPEMRSCGLAFERSPAKSSRPTKTITLDDDSDSGSDALPDLADVDFSKMKRNRTWSESPPAKQSKSGTLAASMKSKDDKEKDKTAKAQAREAERQRKQVEKERAKTLKAAEKVKQKALEEVNKKRTNHKISTPEMIVDLPDSLRPALKIQIETLLGDLSVDFEPYHPSTDNVIRWRRKVTAVYDADEAIWRDIPPQILTEEHVLVILEAPEFVKLALGNADQSLEAHVQGVRSTVPKASVIYIIEGLAAWMRKNRNARNRQYVNSVRAEPEAPPTQSRKRKAPLQEYIDEDSVEDALLSLQVLHGALIHQTGAMVETAQWISVFTQHISTVPYRRAQAESADAGFCMEAGQVRTGNDSKDTYVRMLQEIGRITAPIAYGIAAEFPTLLQLICGLETNGPLALAECRKSANQDGAFSDRKIGPAVSKRVHKIFTGRDPGSTDV